MTILLLIVGMLLTGSLNTITTKIQFTLGSTDVDGQPAVFKKAWSGAFNMMFAMSLVGVFERCYFFCCAPRMPKLDNSEALLSSGEDMSYRRKVCLVFIPAAFDLFATALCCIGMIYLPASVWSMLKGATLIFAAMFSVLFLKRKLLAYHCLGLALCVLGITIVGSASVLGGAGTGSGPQKNEPISTLLFGIGIVVFGQIVQASQVIAEEYLMKSLDLPAMHVVGYEGMWGVFQMVVIVYPILYMLPGGDHGHLEDVSDTVAMISNSTPLFCMILLYIFSCGTYNATGIAITGALSAVHRTMLDASRTMLIWGFDLFVHYFVDANSAYGEAWTPYSYIQLLGFLSLVTGQMIYGEIIKVPGLSYPPPMVVDTTAWATPGAVHLASPLPPTRERAESVTM